MFDNKHFAWFVVLLKVLQFLLEIYTFKYLYRFNRKSLIIENKLKSNLLMLQNTSFKFFTYVTENISLTLPHHIL